MDVLKEMQQSDFMIRPFPKDTALAMAYVPFQNAGNLYSPEHGIRSGTMFPELNKPFEPDCRKEGD